MNRKYGLEPFVVEDYGNMNASVHVVAVARKRDHYMTLFNLKSKFSYEKYLFLNIQHMKFISLNSIAIL